MAKRHNEVAEFAQRYAVFQQASGFSADQKLAWLFEFIARDLTSETERARAAEDLDFFAMSRHKAWTGDTKGALRWTFDAARSDQAPRIQAAMRTLLTELAPGQAIALPVAVADTVAWQPASGVYLQTRAAGLARVLSAVVGILTDAGPALGRCAHCQRLFVRTRSQQRFCLAPCGPKARMAAWRDKHREKVSDAQHRKYVARIQRTLPKAVVRRKKSAKS